MKFKFAAGLMLFCGVSASAGAQSSLPSLNLGGAPFNLINLGASTLGTVLAPVFLVSGPSAGQFVQLVNPLLFNGIGPFTSALPVLPGLPF